MQLIAILFTLCLALPALAQHPDVTLPLVSGTVTLTAGTAAHTADAPDTASLAVVRDGTVLVCAPDAGPAQTVRFSAVEVTNPGDGSPVELKARAYPVQGCTGDLWTDSENSAFVLFSGPGAPSVLDGSGTPDITIP